MHLRPLLLRVGFAVMLLGFTLTATMLTPRAAPDERNTVTSTLLPLIALPLVHVLLTP